MKILPVLKLFYDHKLTRNLLNSKPQKAGKFIQIIFCHFTPIKNKILQKSQKQVFCAKEIVELNLVNLLSVNLTNFMRISCLLV